jgi:hypothetical protein
VPGLDGAGFDAHPLLAHVVDKPLNAAGTPPIVTLIHDSQPHRQRSLRLRYAPMTGAVEVARILDRLDQLGSIHRAESLGIVIVSAAAWAFFHGLLRGLLDYTASIVVCPLPFVTGRWSFVTCYEQRRLAAINMTGQKGE